MRRPAVVFDRDGTLASVDWCAPKDRQDPEQWRRFNALLELDPVVPEVAALFHSVRPGVARLVVSGRMMGDHQLDFHRRYALERWLAKHDLTPDLLLMRHGGDYRVDSIVKEEMYHLWIETHYDVRLVVDDRPQVCDMWRSLGLHVLQVRDPGIQPLLLPEDD